MYSRAWTGLDYTSGGNILLKLWGYPGICSGGICSALYLLPWAGLKKRIIHVFRDHNSRMRKCVCAVEKVGLSIILVNPNVKNLTP